MRRIFTAIALLVMIGVLSACGDTSEQTHTAPPYEAMEPVDAETPNLTYDNNPAEVHTVHPSEPAYTPTPDDPDEPGPTEPEEPVVTTEPLYSPSSVVVIEPEPTPHDAELGFFVDGNFLGMSQLNTLGIVEFYAHIRPGTDREELRHYRGVAIADILAHFGIDSGSSLVFHSYDGFAAGITMAEALDREQAFIAIWQDGEYFAQRGDLWQVAPFQLVMAQDIFANRFARYITEIVVQ
ncbi:MAG: hypothetical protein FWE21_08000 [Defluviitaleaceae bacterium]|nr:hypothetical protein [Defluviitaleaceae bacterium]